MNKQLKLSTLALALALPAFAIAQTTTSPASPVNPNEPVDTTAPVKPVRTAPTTDPSTMNRPMTTAPNATTSSTPSSSRPMDARGETYRPGSSGTDSTPASTTNNTAFNTIDRNSDGKLDRDELANDTTAVRDFSTLDTNGDTHISNSEWAAYDDKRKKANKPQ